MPTKKQFPPTTIPAIISIVMLLAGIPTIFPYGYYTLLRLVVCGTAAFIAYFSFEEEKTIIAYISILFVFIFNPVIPIHFGKEIWIVIDLITAIFLAITILALRTQYEIVMPNEEKIEKVRIEKQLKAKVDQEKIRI